MKKNKAFFYILIVWGGIFLVMRTLQHFSFGTNAYDLSIFDYGMYYTMKGQLMCEPFHPYGWGSHFAVHFTPILFLVAPLYLLFSGPLFLLHLQVLFVGAAAIPLYLIARRHFSDIRFALLVAGVYLLNRPLLNGVMYDFHPEMLLPLFVFSSYYFLKIHRRPLIFYLFIVLALLIKEDVAVYIFFYGLYLTLWEGERRTGLVVSMLSLMYGAATILLIIPAFRASVGTSGGYEFMGQWAEFGGSIPEIIGHIVSNPGDFIARLPVGPLLVKMAAILASLLFLPLFSRFSLLMVPPLCVALISRIETLSTFGLHYFANLAPFLFLGFLFGLKKIKTLLSDSESRWKKIGFNGLLAVLILITLANSKWNVFKISDYRHLGDYRIVKETIRLIPADGSVAALSSLIPHIPKRPNISMLPDRRNAEYLLIHSELNPWPMTDAERSHLIDQLTDSKLYTCLRKEGRVYLFQKKK